MQITPTVPIYLRVSNCVSNILHSQICRKLFHLVHWLAKSSLLSWEELLSSCFEVISWRQYLSNRVYEFSPPAALGYCRFYMMCRTFRTTKFFEESPSYLTSLLTKPSLYHVGKCFYSFVLRHISTPFLICSNLDNKAIWLAHYWHRVLI